MSRVLKTSSLVKKVFFPQLPRKHEDQGVLVAFKKVLTTASHRFKVAFRT